MAELKGRVMRPSVDIAQQARLCQSPGEPVARSNLTLINCLMRESRVPEGVEDGLMVGRDLRGERLGSGVDRDGR